MSTKDIILLKIATMSNKQKAFAAFLVLLVLFLIGLTIYRSSQKKKAAKEKEKESDKLTENRQAKAPTANEEKQSQLVLPLNFGGNIADMDAVTRATFGEMYAKIFESKKWADEIPTMNLPMAWKVQMLPAYGNALVRFNVFSKLGSQVNVVLDGYGIHTNEDGPTYSIYCSELSTDSQANVPMNEEKKLKSVISNMLKRADAPKPKTKNPQTKNQKLKTTSKKKAPTISTQKVDA